MTNDTLDFLTTHKVRIEQRLQQLIAPQETPHTSLFEGARYSVLAKSKRIRPLLTLATAWTLGKTTEEALDPACALELVHTYSLIHDDLPCMDDDDYRRGQPSLHKVTNEGHAVLVGDFLLTFAFEVIANAPLSSSLKVELIKRLSIAAGSSGMVGGQVMDLAMTGEKFSASMLNQLHQHKTGALIEASVIFGALIAGANFEEQKTLLHFGRQLGLLFQIVDDILDVIHPEKKHGHVFSTDEKNNKTTYVTLLGLNQAKEKAYSLFSSLYDTLSALDKETFLLQEIAQQVINQLKT